MPVVMLARRMYGDGDGWSPTAIQRYLADRHDGHGPDLKTIRRWVLLDEAAAERERERPRERERKRRQRALAKLTAACRDNPAVREFLLAVERGQVAPAPAPEPEPEPSMSDEALLALRARGVPYGAIAVVAELYHGTSMNAGVARYRLRKLGALPQPGRSAYMRREWAAKRAEEARAA